MHEVTAKGILSAQNGMNIYRGCTHGCIYCDSRSDCYQMHHDFEDIEVKANAPALLEEALQKKRKKCMVRTGAMCDPYIHLEETLQYTRRCLEVIDKYGFGLSIQTKSNRILRDLDLLKSINRKSKCVVEITLTTFDEGLCKIIEPNVSTTRERFEVLKTMRDCGIPTIVWLAPALPFLNDTRENLLGLLHYCAEAKVYGVICYGIGMTLRVGNREYYYKKLDEHFPGLKYKYMKMYGDSYIVTSPKHKELYALASSFCRENGIVFNAERCFDYIREYTEKPEFEQLSLDL